MVLLRKLKNKNRIEYTESALGIEKQILIEKKIHIKKKQNVDCEDLKAENGDWTKKWREKSKCYGEKMPHLMSLRYP